MAVAVQRFTLDEYLKYDDGADGHYELVDGELLPKGLGTGKHCQVMSFLERRFEREIEENQLPWVALKGLIGVQLQQGGRWGTCRIPDVVVMDAAQWDEMAEREAMIRLGEAPPFLVVEVVSESTKTVDYRSKRSEYAVLDISEYWIVDPLLEKVTVCSLVDRLYDSAVFAEDAVILSPTFPNLRYTATQISSGQPDV